LIQILLNEFWKTHMTKIVLLLFLHLKCMLVLFVKIYSIFTILFLYNCIWWVFFLIFGRNNLPIFTRAASHMVCGVRSAAKRGGTKICDCAMCGIWCTEHCIKLMCGPRKMCDAALIFTKIKKSERKLTKCKILNFLYSLRTHHGRARGQHLGSAGQGAEVGRLPRLCNGPPEWADVLQPNKVANGLQVCPAVQRPKPGEGRQIAQAAPGPVPGPGAGHRLGLLWPEERTGTVLSFEWTRRFRIKEIRINWQK
jgi:hypothetical protein